MAWGAAAHLCHSWGAPSAPVLPRLTDYLFIAQVSFMGMSVSQDTGNSAKVPVPQIRNQPESRRKPSSSPPERARYPPGIGLLVAVVEGLQPLLLLLLAQLGWVRNLEESWCKLHQPARIDGCHLTHVFLGGQHQFVIHHPVKGDSKSGNQVFQTRSNKTRAGAAKLAPLSPSA